MIYGWTFGYCSHQCGSCKDVTVHLSIDILDSCSTIRGTSAIRFMVRYTGQKLKLLFLVTLVFTAYLLQILLSTDITGVGGVLNSSHSNSCDTSSITFETYRKNNSILQYKFLPLHVIPSSPNCDPSSQIQSASFPDFTQLWLHPPLLISHACGSKCIHI